MIDKKLSLDGHVIEKGLFSDGREKPPAPRLRIAQIAPLFESVPPALYGGTERVISFITEELVRRGHHVTLFAAGDSKTSARLRPGCSRALRRAGLASLGNGINYPMLSGAYESAQQFDIIHAHLDYWSFPFARLVNTPTVTTMHGRLDLGELHPIYSAYRDLPLVSISDSQRGPLPSMNWAETIYHGLPRGLLPFNRTGGEYLAFLGRISPEKRPDLAIDVALKAGMKIRLAAKVDEVDRDYFNQIIVPKLSSPDVEFIGEIGEREKAGFLGHARALLFTIDWPEPFGLVMIEAFSCGTPVIARPIASVPEIVRDGITGFTGWDVDELAAAVPKTVALPRERCRAEFESRFTVEAMVDRYERLYQKLIAARRPASSAAVRQTSLRREPAIRLADTPPVNSPEAAVLIARSKKRSGAAG